MSVKDGKEGGTVHIHILTYSAHHYTNLKTEHTVQVTGQQKSWFWWKLLNRKLVKRLWTIRKTFWCWDGMTLLTLAFPNSTCWRKCDVGCSTCTSFWLRSCHVVSLSELRHLQGEIKDRHWQEVPLLLWKLEIRDVMPTHTLAQIISGVGTPMARQGRVMGVPSIVLNTWGPCWMVGITGNKKKNKI